MLAVRAKLLKMEFTSTTQGKCKLADGGFLYVYKKELANGAESVKNVVNTYAARRANMLGYLRAIAYNLSF